jgi:hypothetical protein
LKHYSDSLTEGHQPVRISLLEVIVACSTGDALNEQMGIDIIALSRQDPDRRAHICLEASTYIPLFHELDDEKQM